MKGIRFYEELDNKNRVSETSQGNVLAVLYENGFFTKAGYMLECISATFYYPDSDVSSGSAHIDYIRKNCRRISEAKAREIHPRLFTRLDD